MSPQWQLALMYLLADRAAEGAQFIIATHSPMLLTTPECEIIKIEDGLLARVAFDETDHYQLTRAVLQDAVAFWGRLKQPRI